MQFTHLDPVSHKPEHSWQPGYSKLSMKLKTYTSNHLKGASSPRNHTQICHPKIRLTINQVLHIYDPIHVKVTALGNPIQYGFILWCQPFVISMA